jgi:hypothetical protein
MGFSFAVISFDPRNPAGAGVEPGAGEVPLRRRHHIDASALQLAVKRQLPDATTLKSCAPQEEAAAHDRRGRREVDGGGGAAE